MSKIQEVKEGDMVTVSGPTGLKSPVVVHRIIPDDDDARWHCVLRGRWGYTEVVEIDRVAVVSQ